MKKCIVYGSSTGTTKEVAAMIAAQLGIGRSDIYDVSSVEPEQLKGYDMFILGTSTWGIGELQEDWEDGLGKISGVLSGKTVALFGCGDSSSFGATFCDGMGIIYERLQGCGCRFVGETDASEYSFEASVAETGGRFVGLAIDQINEAALTDSRIIRWCAAL